ncbi:MAG: hypothetical protein AAGA20_05140 [Planctomycetota bacterium]
MIDICPRRARRAPKLTPLFALAAVIAAGCSSDDEDDEEAEAFVVQNSFSAAATPAEPLDAFGDLLVWRMSEAGQGAGGTDFNGDGDFNDAVPVRQDTVSPIQVRLDVATRSLEIAQGTLFLVVSEADDSRDWNSDLDTNDLVLLYHTGGPDPVFYDELEPGTSDDIAVVGGNVVYASAIAPTLPNETNLMRARVSSVGAAPDPPASIPTGADPVGDGITFEVIGSEGDIVFLVADETVDGDLNGDTDANDETIFAVLDARSQMPEAVLSGLPMAAASTPTAASVSSGNDWLVAFLVDEDAQEANLNDPGLFPPNWQPSNCMSLDDNDEDDAVLHWFQLADLVAGTAPVNTGLVGDDDGIAYALRNQFVGVVSFEQDEGVSGGCDLNGDGDKDDPIFRWIDASDPMNPILPVVAPARLLAVDDDLPGGSGGVVRMSNAWVLAVDEAADGRSEYDDDSANDRVLIGVHRPEAQGQSWRFLHGTNNPGTPIGVTWMTEDRESPGRFFAAATEDSLALGQNAPADGDFNGDGDGDDSLPTIPVILDDGSPASNRLAFPGITIATSRTTSGLVVKENVAVHRVSEADQGDTDLNGDGDTNDLVLQRFSLVGAFPATYIGTSNAEATPAATFQSGNANFGAFVTDEFSANVDLNADGDQADAVIRYFRLP